MARNEHGDDRCWIYLDVKQTSGDSHNTNLHHKQNENNHQQQLSQQIPQKDQSLAPSVEKTKQTNELVVKINGTLPRQLTDYLELTYTIGKYSYMLLKPSINFFF